MIEEKIQSIQNSLAKNKVLLDLFLKLDKPIESYKISQQLQRSDTHFRHPNKEIKTIEEVEEQTRNRIESISDFRDISLISPSISRLKEFSFPIPANIVLRWSDSLSAFEYISQYSLELSIGTSIYELENYPSHTANSILVSDSTSIYYESTSAIFREREIYQTNGTIAISTVPSHTHVYFEGSDVFFELGSDWSPANYYLINTSGTTTLHFEGFDLPVTSGSHYMELVYATNQIQTEETVNSERWFLI